MRRNESLNDKNALALLMQVYETCVAIYNSYVVKFKDACTIKDGLHGHSRYSILESINIFEQLGIFSLYGLMTMASVNGECRELKEKLKIFIENHKSLLSPTFDNHIIDISLAAIFLTKHSEHGFLDNWISEMMSYIAYSYLNLGLYFPIVSDSIEDFVSLESGATPKEKLMTTSTLLATLVYLSALLRLNKSYSTLKEVTSQVFNKTSLQFWYPDETTDDFLYSSNAGFESGLSLQIEIADDVETMRNRIIAEYKSYNKNINISSIEAKKLLIPLISSRHFRTPILPYYFFEFIMDDDIEYRAGGDLGENAEGVDKR